MVALTLGSLGLLTVGLFTLLAVLLRVAYAFLRRLLNLYTATAEALAVALEATMPNEVRDTSRIAVLVHDSALELGLPEEDASIAASAAWLRSIVAGGLHPSAPERFLEEDGAALAYPMRVVEATTDASLAVEERFRRLAVLLSEATRFIDGCSDAANNGLTTYALDDRYRRAQRATIAAIELTDSGGR